MKLSIAKRAATWMAVGAGAWVLASCGAESSQPAPLPAPPMMETSGVVTGGNRSGAAAVKRKSIDAILNKPARRPGLATGWGNEVDSEINYSNFKRANSKPYGGVATIRYNDRQGADSMGVRSSTKSSSMQSAAGGLVEWGIKSGWGKLNNYWWRGGRLVVGKRGKNYSIVVKNRSRNRVEVVLSVDGLDVMDGKAASIKKAGYIIAPGKTLEVKGFRTSFSSVASFKFSSVGASYANQSGGSTRNVGVIGLAAYTEKSDRWYDARKRGSASPFAEAPVYRSRR